MPPLQPSMRRPAPAPARKTARWPRRRYRRRFRIADRRRAGQHQRHHPRRTREAPLPRPDRRPARPGRREHHRFDQLYGSDAMGDVINIITRKVAQEWGSSVGFDTTLQEHSESGGELPRQGNQRRRAHRHQRPAAGQRRTPGQRLHAGRRRRVLPCEPQRHAECRLVQYRRQAAGCLDLQHCG